MAQSSQDDLLDFLNDPETIKRAVEGSMEKRLKVMAQSNEEEELRLIKELDDLFPDEELIVTEWDTHWPRIIGFILADRKQHELEARNKALDYGLWLKKQCDLHDKYTSACCGCQKAHAVYYAIAGYKDYIDRELKSQGEQS